MSTEAHILAVTIAHARLTLAHQRVRECVLDFDKGVADARLQAIHAADELQAAICNVVEQEKP